jgi:hypothetical protein
VSPSNNNQALCHFYLTIISVKLNLHQDFSQGSKTNLRGMPCGNSAVENVSKENKDDRQ